MVIVTIILSYFTLVFGELVPKRVALKNPEKLAMFTVVPVHWLSVAFSPFIWFLSFSVRMVLKLFGMGGEDDENTVTKEEIRALVAQSAAGGVINASERDMIDGVISLDTKRAEDVMIPRTSVYVIDAEEDLSLIHICPQCSAVTKKSMPNSPYTIDGMPESVSAVIRMTPTMRLPRLAYSTRYTAVKMPKGTCLLYTSRCV